MARKLLRIRRSQGAEAVEPGAHLRGQVHRRAADEASGVAWRGARQGVQDDTTGFWRTSVTGSCRPSVHRHATERTVGGGLHLCGHMAGLRVRRLHDRCLLAHDRRMVREQFRQDRTRSRCARTGFVRPAGDGRTGRSQQQGRSYLSIRYSESLRRSRGGSIPHIPRRDRPKWSGRVWSK